MLRLQDKIMFRKSGGLHIFVNLHCKSDKNVFENYVLIRFTLFLQTMFAFDIVRTEKNISSHAQRR